MGAALLNRAIASAPLLAAVAAYNHYTFSLCQSPKPSQVDPTYERRLRDFVTLLRSIVHEDDLELSHVALEHYGQDQYSFHSGPAPDVAVIAKDTGQVSAILKAAHKFRIPVTARAGGTSLEGHGTTPFRGLVCDFSHMDRVLAVRPGDLDCTVQAGVGWQELNVHLSPYGLFFPVDPGPGAKIGGMVGTGASGTAACKHLPMKANVLSLTVVLADGTVVKTASRARKSVSSYDLTSLFIASEGTLGVVTEATLRLVHTPKTTKIALVAFPDITSACTAVTDLMASGVGSTLGAVELLDAPMMHAVNVQRGFSYPETPHLIFKLTGSETAVADAASALAVLSKQHKGGELAVSKDKESADKLWEARKVALWSAQAMYPEKKVCTTDVCVPLSALPQLMHEFEAFRDTCAAEAGTPHLPVYAVAHAGDGNAHHFILFNPVHDAEVKQCKRLGKFLVDTAIALGGTCTGEHGVGLGKLQYVEQELGPGAVEVMRRIKAALDPDGILNPGKKVPTAASTALGHDHGISYGCDCESMK